MNKTIKRNILFIIGFAWILAGIILDAFVVYEWAVMCALIGLFFLGIGLIDFVARNKENLKWVALVVFILFLGLFSFRYVTLSKHLRNGLEVTQEYNKCVREYRQNPLKEIAAEKFAQCIGEIFGGKMIFVAPTP